MINFSKPENEIAKCNCLVIEVIYSMCKYFIYKVLKTVTHCMDNKCEQLSLN